MNWKIKAHLFRILSVVPYGTYIHFFLQKNITREWPRREQALDNLLIAARKVYDHSVVHKEGHYLEIGAGRDLAVAIALRFMGVKHITCIDISLLAQPQLIEHTAQYLAKRMNIETIPNLSTWHDIEKFGISYCAPSSLEQAHFADSSFDCFYSIDTLEHIPKKDLKNIFSEVKRVLKLGATSVHCIDYGDHYARSDQKISRFNFLTFTREQWDPFNNKFQYVNRLRHSQILKLITDEKMQIIKDEPFIAPAEKDIADSLAPQFKDFDKTDLFTLRATVVATNNK